MRQKIVKTLLVFALAAALVATGCIGGGTPTQTQTETGTSPTETATAPKHKVLVIGYTRDPDTLDPQKSTWVDITTSLVFATLINIGTDGKIIPGLAESWEISEDGKVITFHLRKGIKDALGNPITAEDVKFVFDRLMNPETRSPMAPLVLGPLKEVKVIDDYTVQLIYEEPYGPALPFLATMPPVGIFSKEFYEKVGPVQFGQTPAGTGPYYVVKWVRGAYIEYKRNPYWKREYRPDPALKNPGPPYIETIRFRIIKEPFTLVSEFKKGNIHVLLDVPPEFYKELANDPNVEMIPALEYVLHYIGFNCQKYPFNDTRVRQAINMAINREEIIKYALEGLAVPVHGPLVPSMNGYSEKMEEYAKQKYPYDPEKAKQLLAEAGWVDRDGDGILEDKNGNKFIVEMWISTGELEAPKVAQIIQAQLAKIGIKVKIRTVEESSFTDLVSKGLHQMYLLRYGLQDAQILLYMFHSKKGVKRMFFYRKDLDEALDKMGTTVDPQERQRYIEEAEKILIDGAPMVPLYARKVFLAYRKDVVEGIVINPYTLDVYLDDAKLK
ncbi:dipeptide ABC transporter, dipeptide-binding protein [Pyrococcus sp. NA2]|uniref:ABC transporter substrate-binding protein n=1 Tax=Pyrococcus sp. (strain NA2) TaxID=342949 RepID=UPI000209AD30|nr:ABC transporter substrate-binding protein [Pyrococcus sp. NA2]AEC51588.1 dipeptide ABC transporter, dipeptide-binding protein [Pyrococcus sp. NA2]